MTSPRAIHLPPAPAPTRPNLLSSVTADPAVDVGRWEFGIEYQPPRYQGTGSYDPCERDTKTVTDSPSIVEWDPYWITLSDQCSTFQEISIVEARARAALEAQTSHLIEGILWTNTVNSTDYGATHPNVGLSDDGLAELNTVPTQAQIDAGAIYTPNAYTSYPITRAFTDMVEALGDMLGGARGMIHVEKRLLPSIVYSGMAVQNGQRLTTTLGDHIVVPGTGYTGSAPSGEAASANYSWIYGTSMVEVFVSPIAVFGTGGELVNRSTNEIEVRAERLALAHWDRQAHIAISVCIEDPFGDCSDAGS